jgi:hypothetical protein
MFLYRDVLQDRAGNKRYGSVAVTLAGTDTPATIYADYQGATPLPSNEVLTNSDGEFWFYLGNGVFDLTVTVGTTEKVIEGIVVGDVNVFNVKLRGARGNGTAIDFDAIQDCISEAELLIGSNAYNDVGVQIDMPFGRFNIGENKLRIRKGGVSLVGPEGRGAVIIGAGDFIEMGDDTNAVQTTNAALVNLTLFNTDTSNEAKGVKLYRTIGVKLKDLNLINFDIGIDAERASTTRIEGVAVRNQSRTTSAFAMVRMQGTDETGFDTPAVYTPGGGVHITDFEGRGASPTADTTHGFLIKSCDGLYGVNIHAGGCEETISLRPDGNAENRVIADLHITNLYCDEPSPFAASPKAFVVGGSVSEAIACDVGTAVSIYRGVRINNSWYDNANQALDDLSFTRLTLRQFRIRGLHGFGAQSGAYVEPSNFEFTHNLLEDNNTSGATGGASDIQLAIASGSVSANGFGPAGADGADYTMQIVVSDGGATDNPNAMVQVVDNNLTRCRTPAIRQITITRSETGARVVERGNILPGTGRDFECTFSATTVGAVAVDLWEYVIPAGSGGNVTVILQGSKADGSSFYGATHTAIFNRDGSSAALKGGAFTTVDSWDRSSLYGGAPPTSTLSSSTLKSTVTGLLGETIYWTARVSIDFNR